MNTVLLCGPFAPPAGGVSIHLQRLCSTLESTNEFTCLRCDEARTPKEGIFHLRSLHLFDYLKLVLKSDIVHIHSGPVAFAFFHLCIAKFFRRKTLVTIHSWKKTKHKTRIWKQLLLWLANHVVVVNASLEKAFTPNQISVIPAFIPPNMILEPRLPTAIMDWFRHMRDQHRVIIASNAWRLDTHENHDLYGLDLCIEMMKHHKVRAEYALLFMIADPNSHKNKIMYWKNEIQKHHLSEFVVLVEGSHSFIRVIEHADILVRATNTDGDALSVREALWLGKQAIASDAVPRPKETFLFQNRNVDSLVAAVLQCKHAPFQPTPQPTADVELIKLYQKLLHSS